MARDSKKTPVVKARRSTARPPAAKPSRTASKRSADGARSLDDALLLRMHELMVQARALEERLIAMYKSGHGYFWIGGPGEEAFNVALGLLIKKGQGPAFDYLHFHYRQSATFLAMGEAPLGALRQMKNTASDPYSGGRNFAGHFSKREWNLCPVTSPIEVQYVAAPGTALMQKRHGGDGITIVTGGDAGTAEGDFASCLVWATRPGQELPVLIIVTNNRWGISTPYAQVQGAQRIADRGLAFGMRTKTIDGNDPIVAYTELQAAMDYVRTERRPFLLEANVSRLHGHSSASGANYVEGEPDCISLFEATLAKRGLLSKADARARYEGYVAQMADLARQVKEEPLPAGDTIWEHVYAGEGPAAPLPRG